MEDFISEYSLKEHIRNSTLLLSTKLWYIAIVILSVIVFVYVMVRTIRITAKEIKEPVRDYFKLAQLVFILWYMVTRNAFMFAVIIPHFEFFYIPGLSISVFFFYYYEHINNLWWLSFIMHILTWVPDEFGREHARKMRFKETTMLSVIGSIVVLSATLLIVIIILGLAFDCSKWTTFFTKEGVDWPSNSSQCGVLLKISKHFMDFMFYFGWLAAGCKIIIGILLLRIMKKKLLTPYNSVKKSIILTVILTPVTMGINAIVNFWSVENYAVFYVFVCTKLKDSAPIIIAEFFAEFAIYVLEIFLMWFTTDNISFRDYILWLLYGVERMDLMDLASIFLNYVPENQSVSESRSGSIKSFVKSDQKDEDASRRLIESYDTQVMQSGFHLDLSGNDSYIESQNDTIMRSNDINRTKKKQVSMTSSLLPSSSNNRNKQFDSKFLSN